MCHEHFGRTRDRRSTADEETEDGEESLPPFLNDSGSEDVEVLTDGGDGE